MSVEIRVGDCLEIMRGMPEASVDAVVTDPPYGLEFMGQGWDKGVPPVEVWAECLRVLKPGGHLLAFAGTRTQHRMATRIEDAGFEIRDMIMYCYGSGFPKSHNIDKALKDGQRCNCTGDALPYTRAKAARAQTLPERELRPLRGSDVSQAVNVGSELRETLQPGLPQQGTPADGSENGDRAHEGAEQPRMEGRSHAPQEAGQLRLGALHASAGVGEADGEDGRLCDGAPTSDGGAVRIPADADGVHPSPGPRPAQQRAGQPGALAGQPQSQVGRAWPACGRCGLPVVPRGLGSALKPALEPITVARKPFRGTLAANVLAHGTGALNVDGCRVGTDDSLSGSGQAPLQYAGENHRPFHDTHIPKGFTQNPAGRWPANLILSWPEDEYELREDVTAEQRRELFGWLHENA